ncbi:primary-amine oxidase [Fusarium oxysporum f. sp. melonis 26406]|nr:primary-amine oxidase [Fusarium oxysporum f. sp. melonis 26406]
MIRILATTPSHSISWLFVDLCAMKVKKILRLPLGPDQSTTKVHSLVPHRRTNPVEAEYTHRLQKSPPRTTMKPYQVIQPEGASFTVKGHLIEWEKFRFRVGFNWREGITIHDVRFMDRSAFYRLSLSEMFVPYGDPRNPIYRKGAFDLGNVGAGVTANNLALGCDCLGVIKYLDGTVVSNDGSAVLKPNSICIHEVDQGIQWKHTNHRTKNATVVRKRQLVLQQIITVANYEYIFAWIFDQSGEISFETRATGILSTQPIDKDVNVPWGTRVGDGVMAPYHQHIFNVRIDPAIGGHSNTFAYSDSVRMPWDDELNPLGTGYVTKETVINRAGPVDDSVEDGRVFKIINRNVQNPVSGTPIGWKIVPIRSQMLLAQPGSWHWRRSEFAEHPMWVTKYKDRQLFPAGDYTNQSIGGTGIKSWVDKPDFVVDDDIVIWHTFGFNHIPRVEDFPIMPAEIAQMHLKPFNFCEYNPTNDVPPSSQAFNKSVLYEDQEKVAEKASCCGPKL